MRDALERWIRSDGAVVSSPASAQTSVARPSRSRPLRSIGLTTKLKLRATCVGLSGAGKASARSASTAMRSRYGLAATSCHIFAISSSVPKRSRVNHDVGRAGLPHLLNRVRLREVPERCRVLSIGAGRVAAVSVHQRPPVGGRVQDVAAVLEDALRRVEGHLDEHDAAGLLRQQRVDRPECRRSACSAAARAATR